MVTTTVIAWSFCNSALNICPTDGESTFTVDFSLMLIQVIVIKITNNTAMINANHLKPARSLPCPNKTTHFTVIIVISAEPTPAQDRARVESPSLSLPPSVNAGIMDQNGISIMV